MSELRENPALWLGLSMHLEVNDAEFVLKVLREHSGWRQVGSLVEVLGWPIHELGDLGCQRMGILTNQRWRPLDS